MKAVLCPVCGGTGQVDSGFYTQTSGQWTSTGGVEICRSCWGKGYILIPTKLLKYCFPIYPNYFVPTKTAGDD